MTAPGDLAPPATDPRRRWPVQLHVFIVLSVLGAAPVATHGIGEAQRWGVEAAAHADALAQQAAKSAARSLEDRLRDKTAVLQAMAGGLGADFAWTEGHLQPELNGQIAQSRAFDSVYLADTTGTSLVFAPRVRADGVSTAPGVNYAERDYYEELMRTHAVAYSRVQLGKQSGIANVMIAVPIHGDPGSPGAPCPEGLGHDWAHGPLRGYLAAGVSLAELSTLASRAVPPGSNARLLIIDGERRVLVDSAGRLPALSRLQPGPGGAVDCPEAPIEGEDDLSQRVRQWCTPIALGQQRWQVWVNTPMEDLEAAAGRARTAALRAVLINLGLALLASGAVSWMFGRRVRRASALAERVSAGDLSLRPTPPDWYAPREIAELSDVVGMAIGRLATSDAEKQALVDRLEQANRRMEPLADAWAQVGEAIEIMDGEGVVRFVNPAYGRLMGAAFSVGHRSALADLPRLMAQAREGQPWRGELQVETIQGLRVQSLTASPVLDPEGRLSRLVVIRRDITDRRLAEAAATNNERLAAVGTLAAGLAHEINNPLMVIRGALEQQQLRPDAPETQAAVRDALAAAGSAQSVVHALLSLSAADLDASLPDVLIQVDELLRSCAVLSGPLARPRVRVLVEVDGTPTVRGRRADLAQVVLNLVTNAIQAHAAGDGPMCWIRLSAGRRPLPEGGDVWIEVADNGPGMSAEVLRRAFDPFFTTRTVGAGVGLGLSLSRQIVEAHRGRLGLRSTPGSGTVARITLPSAASPAADPLAEPTTPRRPAPQLSAHVRSQRVLVVDDDPPVARSLARMLRGHEVHVAIGGEDALARLANERFDVVVSDVMMPGIDGPTLFDAATRGWPELRERFIFVTGAATSGAVAAALRATGRPVLLKPIDPAAIRSLVEQTGGGTASG